MVGIFINHPNLFVFMFQFLLPKKGQGWVEYVIIIAVIVVIGLILLGIFGNFGGAESVGATGGH